MLSATVATLGAVVKLYVPLVVPYFIVAPLGVTPLIAQLCDVFGEYVQLLLPQLVALLGHLIVPLFIVHVYVALALL